MNHLNLLKSNLKNLNHFVNNIKSIAKNISKWYNIGDIYVG